MACLILLPFGRLLRYPSPNKNLGTEVDESLVHVVLDGRKIGPYDRRTIVGMRIKKALTSEHVLIGMDGAHLTVAGLIGQRPSQQFNADRSQSFSIVQATFGASLVHVEGTELRIPAFKDEVEVRVQGGVLRIAGRFRKGFGWKEDRVKLQMSDVVHARVKGSLVDLWLRTGEAKDAPLRRMSLDLFTPEAAGELLEFLPGATPWPHGDERVAAPPKPDRHMLWVPAIAVAVVIVVVLVLVVSLGRRVY